MLGSGKVQTTALRGPCSTATTRDRRGSTKVIVRAGVPLLKVTELWERDGLTPWCIFLDGISRTAGHSAVADDAFTLRYGGADTVVGARRVRVTIKPEQREPPPLPPPHQGPALGGWPHAAAVLPKIMQK